MSDRRRYGQGCAVAHALDLVGERWALLVVRELRLGPRRYADLQRALPDVGPSTLSLRLRDLRQTGVVRRRSTPPPAAATVYELTDWGHGLDPVFAALARWGLASPVVPMAGDTSNDAVMLGLRTFSAGAGDPAAVDVHLDGDSYRVELGAGVTVRRDATGGPVDATVHTGRATVAALLHGELSLAAAQRGGRLTVRGDRAVVRRLFTAAVQPV